MSEAADMDKTDKSDLETQKNNVFVTQLQEKDEDEKFRAFATDAKKTLQRQLLVKKEKTIACMKQELAEKRREFETRMDGFAQRRSALEEKRQKMKDRVTKFERFIRENDQKRERAVTKYYNENQAKQNKSKECTLLYTKIMELKKRHTYLTKKIESYGIYKKFLNRIIETLPEDYACVSDDKLHSLLLRYQTLNATNDKLIKRLTNAGDQLEQLKQVQEEIQGVHAKEKFEADHEITDLIKKLETHTEMNEKKEQLLMRSKGNHRERKLELGVILLAIDTIVEKCHEDSYRQNHNLTIDEKLNCIKEWLLNQSGVVELVKTEMAQISDERHSKNPVDIKIIQTESK